MIHISGSECVCVRAGADSAIASHRGAHDDPIDQNDGWMAAHARIHALSEGYQRVPYQRVISGASIRVISGALQHLLGLLAEHLLGLLAEHL